MTDAQHRPPLLMPPTPCVGVPSASGEQRRRAETLFLEGNRHMRDGAAHLAEACFRDAIRAAPDAAAAHANLAYLLEQRGDDAAAEACYRDSLEIDADHSVVHLNLGALLARQKRFDDAQRSYMTSLTLRPDAPGAWSNLGVLYACSRHDDAAERCYRIALRLDPDHANASFNLSYLLLRQGRFEEGWERLEARDWYRALEARIACPRWRGESLAGKSLLIGFEAGHGDMIQFCRYAAVLKSAGAARITLLCHPALKTLFAQLDAVDSVVAFDEPIASSGCDFWTPPLSIPRYCGTRLDSIPSSLPYLRAPNDRVARWTALLPAGNVRVGLAWRGNPAFENDSDRSLPSLDALAPLAAVEGVQFISLQKGAGEDEARRPPPGLRIVDLGSRVDDFADTAGIIAQLDLVIAVDTAVAHLAGALGKPCWILLPDYKTDWRWLTDRDDSPWYPGVVRLFRQRRAGHWDDVVSDVVTALAQFANRERHP